jgi:hypothetical protein
MTDIELDNLCQRSRVVLLFVSQQTSLAVSAGVMDEFTPRSTCRKALSGVLLYMGTPSTQEGGHAH